MAQALTSSPIQTAQSPVSKFNASETPVLKFDRIRPVSKFAPTQPKKQDYWVINFNDADQIMNENDYDSLPALTKDLHEKIRTLVPDFSVIHLYHPADCSGHMLMDMTKLRNVAQENSVRWSFNRSTGMWSFIPMHPSVFKQVYDWQLILQFTFYPKVFMGIWNLDLNKVRQVAAQGHCNVRCAPEEGVWTIEPWLKAGV